jgi:hypothetical protein
MAPKTTTPQKLTDLLPADHQADAWQERYGATCAGLEAQAGELEELAQQARERRERDGVEPDDAVWHAGLAGHLLRLSEAARRAHDALV